MSKKKAVQKPIKSVTIKKPQEKKHYNFFLPLIFIFTVMLYSNTFTNGFVMDDGAMITDNKTVMKGFDGIKEIFQQSTAFGSTGERFGAYRPLTMTFFATEIGLFGKDNFMFHLIHVLFYALGCMVVFLVLKKLLKKYNPLLPLLSILFFIAHPVHTEVAANLKSMDEILCIIFSFLSLLFFYEYYEKSRISYALIGWLLFFLSLFTKENAATFIIIIPLALYYFFEKTDFKKLLLISIPNLLFVLIFLYIRSKVLDEIPPRPQIINNTLAASSDIFERFATILFFQLYNLRLLFFPNILSWDYGFNQLPLKTFSDSLVLLSLLVFSGMFIFAIITLKKKNIISFFVLFYFITLIASSNILQLIAATIAERFLFMPSVSFCILLSFLILKINKIKIQSFSQEKKMQFIYVISGLIFILFSIKTFSRNKDWQSNMTLFASGVNTSPNSYRTNTAYAFECVKAGEKETDSLQKKNFFHLSVNHFKKAISVYAVNPSDWFNLGVAYNYLSMSDSAEPTLLKAYQLDSNNISRSYSLGVFYKGTKNHKQSLKYFIRTKQLDTKYDDVDFEIALNYHLLNDLQNAIKYYEFAILRKPNHHDALSNILIIYKNYQDIEKVNYYSQLLEKVNK